MIEKLWFLKLNDDIVGVFDDYDIALEEKDFLKEENHSDKILLRKIEISKLRRYTEEYEMADERGYLERPK